MKRILLTGMSGTGKSTVIDELAARGYKAVDLDQPGWSEYAPDGEWVWSEARVKELLISENSEMLFVSGCAINRGNSIPILTSYPPQHIGGSDCEAVDDEDKQSIWQASR